jgi:hypothetical protein
MSTEARSKFAAFLNRKATPENRLPNVTGQFALQDGQTHHFSAWAGRSAKGTLYMKGTHAPQQLAEALKAQLTNNDPTSPGPAAIDLKPGEIILFENLAKQGSAPGESEDDKEKRLKRPDWYGYAHTADGWYQLAGWTQGTQGKKEFIAGTTTRYEPPPVTREANPSEGASSPTERSPKIRARRGGTAKPSP